MTAPDRSERLWCTLPGGVLRRLPEEVNALDHAISDAVARTPTPTMDVLMAWLSDAANYSALWLVIAAAMALAGGRTGLGAAVRGLAAIGIASATVNLVAKNVFSRSRPDPSVVPATRHVRMPASGSFPSGHTASAFAFVTAVTADSPLLALPFYGLATAVGYSRVHNGVHYASDVGSGAVLGLAVGTVVREATQRRPRSLGRGDKGQRRIARQLADLRDAHGAGPRHAAWWNSES